jgi:hypothetical protein
MSTGRSVLKNKNLLTDMTDSKPWILGGARRKYCEGEWNVS